MRNRNEYYDSVLEWFGIRTLAGKGIRMAARTVDGFFYGLFMDEEVLVSNNVEPRNPRQAYVENYKLYIGQRATMWPSDGDRTYGMIYSLSHVELDNLYGGAGLEDYKPEALLANLADDSVSIACICFNLPKLPNADEMNKDYTLKLQSALSKLGFPKPYVDSLS